MDGVKKIRWTASAALIAGLCFCASSGFIENVSFAKGDSAFLVYYAGIAAKLFTIGAVFVVVYLLQSERAKAMSRLQKLETELTDMRSKLIHLRAFNV